jgi:hypothetical protein
LQCRQRHYLNHPTTYTKKEVSGDPDTSTIWKLSTTLCPVSGKISLQRDPIYPRNTYKSFSSQKIIDANKSELKRAEKCVSYLEHGGLDFQILLLKSCHVKNSKGALIHGEEVTDTIASWITKKFMAGPFYTPPLPDFRANSILAIPQQNKTSHFWKAEA